METIYNAITSTVTLRSSYTSDQCLSYIETYLWRAVEAVCVEYWLNHNQTLCQVFYEQHVTNTNHRPTRLFHS